MVTLVNKNAWLLEWKHEKVTSSSVKKNSTFVKKINGGVVVCSEGGGVEVTIKILFPLKVICLHLGFSEYYCLMMYMTMRKKERKPLLSDHHNFYALSIAEFTSINFFALSLHDAG